MALGGTAQPMKLDPYASVAYMSVWSTTHCCSRLVKILP
jgi:hypothetical protein